MKTPGMSGAKPWRYTVLLVVSDMLPMVRPWNPPCARNKKRARDSPLLCNGAQQSAAQCCGTTLPASTRARGVPASVRAHAVERPSGQQ